MSKGGLIKRGMQLTAEEADRLKKYLMGGEKRIGDGTVEPDVMTGKAKEGETLDAEYLDTPAVVDPLASLKPKSSKAGFAAAAGASMLSDTQEKKEEPKEEVPVVEPEDLPVTADEDEPKAEKPKAGKPKKPAAPVPDKPGEEEKIVLDRMNSNLEMLGQLKDPPITAAELRKQALDDLKGARDNRQQQLEMLGLVEKMIAAVTKYAAASEGLRRGLDMSRADIERTDWDKQIDRVYEKYKLDAKDLLTKYDKEDKEKAAVDTKRESMVKSTQDLKRDLARLKDIRKREAARMRESALRRQEEKDYRDARLAIQRDANDIRRAKASEAAQADQVVSRFTDDPATAKEIANAALMGEKQLLAALNRSGVADKIKPEILSAYRKERWFGMLSPKLDAEKIQEDVLADMEGPSQFPMQVFKGGQVATVSNSAELEEAMAEGWSN